MNILSQTIDHNQDMAAIASAVGKRLAALGQTLATAESCTGGWMAKLVTDSAGSSAWFDRGFVTYSNAAKQSMLGVTSECLSQHGAVSAETVAQMVQGALRLSDADWAVAITGIAGPGGGSAEKPIGTVWFGWGRRGFDATTHQKQFEGNRDEVRQQAVINAFAGLLDRLPQSQRVVK